MKKSLQISEELIQDKFTIYEAELSLDSSVFPNDYLK